MSSLNVLNGHLSRNLCKGLQTTGIDDLHIRVFLRLILCLKGKLVGSQELRVRAGGKLATKEHRGCYWIMGIHEYIFCGGQLFSETQMVWDYLPQLHLLLASSPESLAAISLIQSLATYANKGKQRISGNFYHPSLLFSSSCNSQ